MNRLISDQFRWLLVSLQDVDLKVEELPREAEHHPGETFRSLDLCGSAVVIQLGCCVLSSISRR